MTELNETGAILKARFGRKRGQSRLLLGSPPAPFVLRSGLPQLGRTIEAEIIPRLVMAHGKSAVAGMPVVVTENVHDAAEFAEMILGPENDRAAEWIQSYRDRGLPLETIYLDLLVPTARHLRHLWMDDERDFADITLGLWRLQQLLRDFSAAFRNDLTVRSTDFRVLLTPAPGETHDVGYMMFGLVLAGEFFRRDGWDTWIEPDSAATGFIDTVRTQWFNVVEFFANSDKKLDDLASNIRMVRRESSNQDIGVMVCGPAFTERPELVLLVGGDAVVSDMSKEASQARHVVSLLTDRR